MTRKRVQHGATKIPGYFSWVGMLSRCYKPSNKDYPHYGGRGIAVCEFLRGSPRNLLDVLGVKPDGGSVDRINVDAGYTCGQCAECLASGHGLNIRWASMKVQNRNKRQTLFSAEHVPIMEIAERTGIKYMTLRDRRRRGVNLLRDGSLPEQILHAGELRTAQDWSSRLGIPYVTIRRRFRQGKPIDRRERAPKRMKLSVNMN